MKIAIIDPIHHDIGLNILFPDADYYHMITELNKTASCQKYNIMPLTNISNITDANYDTICIIYPLYNSIKTYNNQKNDFYNEKYDRLLDLVIDIVNQNAFSNVLFFDNNDYDYDPNILYSHKNISKKMTFFKRNYNKTMSYPTNVHAFPYIMFGQTSLIEYIMDAIQLGANVENRGKTRMFFSGTLFTHIDHVYPCYRSRRDTIRRLLDKLPNIMDVHQLIPYDKYMSILSTYKFTLDLNGCGDPNRRTFEIFAAGSLRIGEKNHLEWTFDAGDDFCEETYFADENDYADKMSRLMSDEKLYQKCLQKQQELIQKYMNPERLRNYILSKII